MKRLIIGIVLSSLLTIALPSHSQAGKPLTNQDVVEMVKAGLPESTILLSIQGSPANFTTGSKDLIALQKAGVTTAVMNAMVAKSSGTSLGGAAPGTPKASPAGMSPGTPPGAIQMRQGVVAFDGGRRVQLMRAADRQEYLDTTVGMGLFKKTVGMWIKVANEKSDIRIASRSPTFEVILDGTNVRPSDQCTLLRFTIMGGDRAAEISRETSGAVVLTKKGREEAKQFGLPVKFEAIADVAMIPNMKLFRVSAEQPLEPGEYALYTQGGPWDFGID